MSNAGQPKEEDPQFKFARYLFENQQSYESKVSDGKTLSDYMETLFEKWANKKKNPPTETPAPAPAPAPVAKGTNKVIDSTNSGETSEYDTEISKILANTSKVNGVGICGTIHCNPSSSSPSPPTPETQTPSSPSPTPEGTFDYHQPEDSESTATTNTGTTNSTNTGTTTTSTSSKSTGTNPPEKDTTVPTNTNTELSNKDAQTDHQTPTAANANTIGDISAPICIDLSIEGIVNKNGKLPGIEGLLSTLPRLLRPYLETIVLDTLYRVGRLNNKAVGITNLLSPDSKLTKFNRLRKLKLQYSTFVGEHAETLINLHAWDEILNKTEKDLDDLIISQAKFEYNMLIDESIKNFLANITELAIPQCKYVMTKMNIDPSTSETFLWASILSFLNECNPEFYQLALKSEKDTVIMNYTTDYILTEEEKEYVDTLCTKPDTITSFTTMDIARRSVVDVKDWLTRLIPHAVSTTIYSVEARKREQEARTERDAHVSKRTKTNYAHKIKNVILGKENEQHTRSLEAHVTKELTKHNNKRQKSSMQQRKHLKNLARKARKLDHNNKKKENNKFNNNNNNNNNNINTNNNTNPEERHPFYNPYNDTPTAPNANQPPTIHTSYNHSQNFNNGPHNFNNVNHNYNHSPPNQNQPPPFPQPSWSLPVVHRPAPPPPPQQAKNSASLAGLTTPVNRTGHHNHQTVNHQTVTPHENGPAMGNLTTRPANVSNHLQQRTRYEPNAAARNLGRYHNPYNKPGNTQQIPRYHTPSPSVMSTEEARRIYKKTNPFTGNGTAIGRQQKRWK